MKRWDMGCYIDFLQKIVYNNTIPIKWRILYET